MVLASIALFALAALGGLAMAKLRLGGQAIPMPLALVHGVAAASGLVLLLLAVVMSGGPMLQNVALALFVVAALGGFVLFSFQLRKRLLPLPLMFVHAAVAVVAFVLLALVGFHLV